MKYPYPVVILGLSAGPYAVVEEGDPKKPYTLRTFVVTLEDLLSKAKYREAYYKFIGKQ